MATEKNICEFCGQVMVDGMECNCPAAKEKHEIERQIADAKMAIKYVFVNSFEGEMCVPPSDEVIKLMYGCVEMIAYDFVAKVSILLPGNIKANFSKNKGSIKVERVETIKTSQET